ncbi:MAG TPA: hypothetical protein VLY03_13150 [Bacteroidota bacterium]|nr:hypothetical protein [Bacteroidota bacterium]
MEKPYPSLECEVRVGHGGVINLPPPIAARIQEGKRMTIRLTDGTVSAKLRRRGVTEAEIELIASLQWEQREQVINFLESEGSVSRSAAFVRRSKKFAR